jgi:hypothetical protein
LFDVHRHAAASSRLASNQLERLRLSPRHAARIIGAFTSAGLPVA